MRRYVLTGAPGSGKTSIAMRLRARGWAVVEEAATDVIAGEQARGVAQPWQSSEFVDRITRVQHDRQLRALPASAGVQFFDRSPLCTLALAQFLQQPVTPSLADEVERVLTSEVYEREVLLVRPLGFVTATPARTISYTDALRFEAVHEQVYRDHGFTLIDIPAGGDIAHRTRLVEARLPSTG